MDKRSGKFLERAKQHGRKRERRHLKMTSSRELSLILSAKDRMSTILTGAAKTSEKQFESLKKKIEGVSGVLDNIGKKSMLAGGALLAASVFKCFLAASRRRCIDVEIADCMASSRSAFTDAESTVVRRDGFVEETTAQEGLRIFSTQ